MQVASESDLTVDFQWKSCNFQIHVNFHHQNESKLKVANSDMMNKNEQPNEMVQRKRKIQELGKTEFKWNPNNFAQTHVWAEKQKSQISNKFSPTKISFVKKKIKKNQNKIEIH